MRKFGCFFGWILPVSHRKSSNFSRSRRRCSRVTFLSLLPQVRPKTRHLWRRAFENVVFWALYIIFFRQKTQSFLRLCLQRSRATFLSPLPRTRANIRHSWASAFDTGFFFLNVILLLFIRAGSSVSSAAKCENSKTALKHSAAPAVHTKCRNTAIIAKSVQESVSKRIITLHTVKKKPQKADTPGKTRERRRGERKMRVFWSEWAWDVPRHPHFVRPDMKHWLPTHPHV